MNQRNLGTFMVSLPLCLTLGFAVAACGGNDSSNSTGGSTGGSSSSSGGSSASTGGSSSPKGGSSSSNGGSSSSNGGGTNTGGGFDSGLPDDKTLGSLSPTESQALCDKFDAYFSSGPVSASLQDFDCRLAGVFGAVFAMAKTDADAQTACKAAYDDCKSAPLETTSQCKQPDATCMATAGELEQCLNDQVAALEQAKDSFPSCDTLKLADLTSDPMDMGMQPPESAACTAVETKCPNGPTLETGM